MQSELTKEINFSTKRASMTFFSDPTCHYSHRVRIVLAEKGITADIIDIDPNNKPEDLATLNPYNELPTLVDRDLTLYQQDVVMEYLDERFPHPPLLPVYPVERARCRLYIRRIQRDWCGYVDKLLDKNADLTDKELTHCRDELMDSLVSVSPIFSEKPYFMSDEFTLVDCCVATILWRLPLMGIEIPKKKAPNLLEYQQKVFDRPAFQASLSDLELEMNNINA